MAPEVDGGPMLRCAGMILLFAYSLAAGDAPSSFVEVAHLESDWMGALHGLHVRYALIQEIPSGKRHGDEPGATMVGEVMTETWIAADGQRYRYETHVDHDRLA